MNIFERFIEYAHVTEYDIDRYGFSIAEQIAYSFILVILVLISVFFLIFIVLTTPIWVVPYLIYKNKKLKEE